MRRFNDTDDYLSWLEDQAVLPPGFRTGTASLRFRPEERPASGEQAMDLTALLLDEPTEAFGAVFTRNALPGWPVLAGRALLDAPRVSGVLVNNRVANVRTPGGREAADRLTAAFGRTVGAEAPLVPASTGVIGWSLPVPAMEAAFGDLAAGLGDASLAGAARSIMTTDAWPKARTVDAGGYRVTGIAKGAGMIEPGLATMLVFLVTDADIDRTTLRQALAEAAETSFNRISVDGDQSPSDGVYLFASRRGRAPSAEAFRAALDEVCRPLAADLVRNGEGTGHVLKVTVVDAADEEEAVAAGKALVNSPLTKTAVAGNDPNTGRFLQALGAWAGMRGVALDPGAVKVRLGDVTVYEDGLFRLDAEAEAALSAYLAGRALPLPAPGYPAHDLTVDIRLGLGRGGAEATVLGSDLSTEYVHINADYRT